MDEQEKYDRWMKRVDTICWSRLGMSYQDMPDWNWRDAFEDGATPSEAVRDFMEDEGYDF